MLKVNEHTDVDEDEDLSVEKDEYPGVRVSRIMIKKIWGQSSEKEPSAIYKISQDGASKLMRAI